MTAARIKSRQLGAHRMIQRWGGIGYLLRASVQRAATMARMEYRPAERGLYLDKSVNIRISVIGLATPPDHEQDQIIFRGQLYNILMPVTGPSPDGDFVFYDCNSIIVGVAP